MLSIVRQGGEVIKICKLATVTTQNHQFCQKVCDSFSII